MTANARRVAVIGAGLGGLSAAIHLRLAGFDVVVYERGERVGGRAGRIERQGFRFDTGPSLLNYPWVFQELFAAAGRRLADHLELLPVDPTVKFVWPDGETFTLSSQLPALAREFERVEPGILPGLMAFLADAEAKYQLAMRKIVTRNADGVLQWFAGLGASDLLRTAIWRSMHRELRRFFRSPRIVDALGSYAMYLGGSPRRLPGIFTILPYGEIAYGLWAPRGGVSALVDAVLQLALDLGVSVVTGRDVRRITVTGGDVRGVEFADGGREQWTTVVSNVDVPTTQSELLNGIRRFHPPVMTPGVLTCYMGLRGAPAGLGHHTVYMPEDTDRCFRTLLDERRVPDDLAFYACAATATDPGMAPEGHSTLFLLAPVPLVGDCPGAQDGEWERALRDRMLVRMESHGAAVPPDQIVFEEHWGPHEWHARCGLYRGSAFGAAHTLRQIGPWRSPNRDRGIGGLYYVGAGTTPGTGMPMVVLSGRMTAERVIADVR